MKKIKRLCIILLGSAILTQLYAQNPLAGLPGQPGSHVAQIQALGDNEWLNLGQPAADPQWGRAEGRSWGGYMAYAADLGGAFFAGQSTHGFIKANGCYDDIFFYDINANKWICVFPGVNTTTFTSDINAGNLKMRDDGQFVDKNGQPIPLSYNGHSYKSYTYASILHRWVTVICGSGVGGDQYAAQDQWYIGGNAILQAQMAGKTDSVSGTPFFYNVTSGQFERFHFKPALQNGAQGASSVYELPLQQKLLYYRNDGTTLLGDLATGTWTSAGATGRGPGGIDCGQCYDSKRNRIYMGAGGYGPAGDMGKIFRYDAASKVWSAHSNPYSRSLAGSNTSCVNYDSVSDKVLDFDHNYNNANAVIHVFNPETMSWDDSIPVPLSVSTYPCWHSFYSPELNAHFFYLAVDSYNNGVMWAYRYKAAASAVERAVAAKTRVRVEVSPNPFRQNIKIDIMAPGGAAGAQVKVFDLRGRMVADLSVALEDNRGAGFEWNAGNLNTGVYLVRVTHQGKTIVKSLICER